MKWRLILMSILVIFGISVISIFFVLKFEMFVEPKISLAISPSEFPLKKQKPSYQVSNTAHQSNTAFGNISTITQSTIQLKTKVLLPYIWTHKDIQQLPNLESIDVREDYSDKLTKLSAKQLWEQWFGLKDFHDENTSIAWLLTESMLIQKLQNDLEQIDLYEDIRNALYSPELSTANRTQLIAMLGLVATPKSTEILIEQLAIINNAEQRFEVLQAILRTANTQWDNRFHPELSPVLEKAWQDYRNSTDNQLLNTIGTSLAKTGATTGIKLLLDEIQQTNQSLDELYKNNKDLLPLVAISSIIEVTNPDAIPLLTNYFSNPTNETVFIVSGESLARMGTNQATDVLLQWASNAPPDRAALAERWFSQIRDTTSIDKVMVWLESVYFKDNLVREAVARGLNKAL